jgi:hypothetical protein
LAPTNSLRFFRRIRRSAPALWVTDDKPRSAEPSPNAPPGKRPSDEDAFLG